MSETLSSSLFPIFMEHLGYVAYTKSGVKIPSNKSSWLGKFQLLIRHMLIAVMDLEDDYRGLVISDWSRLTGSHAQGRSMDISRLVYEDGSFLFVVGDNDRIIENVLLAALESSSLASEISQIIGPNWIYDISMSRVSTEEPSIIDHVKTIDEVSSVYSALIQSHKDHYHITMVR